MIYFSRIEARTSVILMFYFISLILFASISAQEQSSYTCLLAFVIEPCINDGQNLWCTFSLNSTERRNTCDLSSISLIFTTFHIELFIIPQYYHQLPLRKDIFITKLIIETDIVNDTYKYLHWLSIPVLSLELSKDIYKLEIIHEIDNIQVTSIVSSLNKSYWHLSLWPIKRNVCHRTNSNMDDNWTRKYDCPREDTPEKLRNCGHTYVCLDDYPCYFTGYKRLVCEINIFGLYSTFKMFDKITQYETIYIIISNIYLHILHQINHDSFVFDKQSAIPNYIAKQIIIVISVGVVQISTKLFNISNQLTFRIEHSSCENKQLILDIVGVDNNSFRDNLRDYTTTLTGGIGCQLDETDATMIDQFKPHIVSSEDTEVQIGRSVYLTYVITGLLPFTIQW
ncbi:hypothetical protein I4U23_030708 [Adineta vaga]|nr:hypothetical protein I4U23_030708 [Adineta vaga]